MAINSVLSYFRRNPDGSWTVTAPVTVNGPNGSISLSPGISFRRGVAFQGLDIAAWLDSQYR